MQEIGGDAAGRVGAQPAQRIVRHRGQRGRAHRDGEKPVLQVVGEAARAIGGQIAPQVVRETDPGDRRVLVEAVAAVALRGSLSKPASRNKLKQNTESQSNCCERRDHTLAVKPTYPKLSQDKNQMYGPQRHG